MQTFVTDINPIKSAENLDNKRLGKQRVEALQIADCLLVKESRWKNHPAVKMWKGHESFLVNIYIICIMSEWEKRGFNNLKCNQWWQELHSITKDWVIIIPRWWNKDFVESHRSNLIRKDKDFYKKKFIDTVEGLEYIWP